MQEQSFCWSESSQISFSPILTKNGLCYTFNGMKSFLNQKMYDFQYALFLIQNAKNFRIAFDFLDKNPVTVNCKNEKRLRSKKSLTIEVLNHQNKSCLNPFGTVMIHRPDELQSDRKHVFLHETKSAKIILRPKITTTDESLRRLRPEIRTCYFKDERKLKYFKIYTKKNCLDECHSDLTFEICECVNYHDARKLNFSITS